MTASRSLSSMLIYISECTHNFERDCFLTRSKCRTCLILPWRIQCTVCLISVRTGIVLTQVWRILHNVFYVYVTSKEYRIIYLDINLVVHKFMPNCNQGYKLCPTAGSWKRRNLHRQYYLYKEYSWMQENPRRAV